MVPFLQTCLVLSVAASAQGRVWIVDVANGAGTNFTNLPPAEAAAAPGDVLLVRAGRYSPFTTSKGIAVLGVPGQTIVTASFLGELAVNGLPAGQTFVAHGLSIAAAFSGSYARFDLVACAGSVHLHRIDGLASVGGSWGLVVRAIGCAYVSLLECGLVGGPLASAFSVIADASDVSIVSSRLIGGNALYDPRGLSWPANDALELVRGSRVFVVGTTLRGGAGLSTNVGFYSSAPAAMLNFGELVVADAEQPNNTIAAGSGATVTQPVSAIIGNGTLRLDPSIVVSSFAGAPPIAPGVVTTIAPIAGLRATGETLGGTLAITLRSTPADPYLIAAGLPAPPLALPFGPLFLLPTPLIYLALGVQGATGSATVTVPLPGNPLLQGVGLGLQAASGAGATLTNAVVVVLR